MLPDIVATVTGERMMAKHTPAAASARRGTGLLASRTTSARGAGGGMARIVVTSQFVRRS
jgi:hypothetical protein